GLMASHVAERCNLLEHAADRELLWFIQSLSHSQGGLKAACADLIATFPARVGTKVMQDLGTKRGRVYDSDEVEQVLFGMPGKFRFADFPLKGDSDLEFEGGFYPRIERSEDEQRKWLLRYEAHIAEAESLPTCYPASVFVEACLKEA